MFSVVELENDLKNGLIEQAYARVAEHNRDLLTLVRLYVEDVDRPHIIGSEAFYRLACRMVEANPDQCNAMPLIHDGHRIFYFNLLHALIQYSGSVGDSLVPLFTLAATHASNHVVEATNCWVRSPLMEIVHRCSALAIERSPIRDNPKPWIDVLLRKGADINRRINYLVAIDYMYANDARGEAVVDYLYCCGSKKGSTSVASKVYHKRTVCSEARLALGVALIKRKLASKDVIRNVLMPMVWQTRLDGRWYVPRSPVTKKKKKKL